jgi:pimeloyl-ACP methyl ester carboxylesterase
VLKTLSVAALVLVGIGAGGLALQRLALARPSTGQLELVKTLRALDGFHGSRATLQVDGKRYRALCTQRWHPGADVARVALGREGVVTELGNRLLDKSRLVSGEFDLAGCPRPLVNWLASELVHGATVSYRRFASGPAVLHEVELRPRTLPIVLFLGRKGSLPVRLALTASDVRGSSVVHYGEIR